MSKIKGRLDWPTFSHDAARTGHTDAVGRITAPRLLWQKDFSAHDVYLEVAPGSAPSQCQLPFPLSRPPLSETAKRDWGMLPPEIDAVGDGRHVDVLGLSPWQQNPSPPGYDGRFFARWGKFLPDVRGMQRLGWSTVKTDRMHTRGERCRLQLHSFENGFDKPNLIWECPTDPNNERPILIVDDIDNDGRLEAVYSRWRGVVAHDVATGEEKYRLMDYRDTHKRPYGFFGSWHSPAGTVYLVVAGVFSGHIGVLTVRDSRLVNLWTHLFDKNSRAGIVRRFSINRIGPDPVGDFTGSGRGEILMNVFNDTGDGRWHLLGYDVETGAHTIDIPDVFLHGHVDVDGDGRDELLCQVCPDRVVARYAELRVYSLSPDAAPEAIWTKPNAHWSMRTLQGLPLNRGFMTGFRVKEPVHGQVGGTGQVLFVSHPEEGQSEAVVLEAVRIDPGGTASTVLEMTARPALEMSAVAARRDRILVRCRRLPEQSTRLECRGGEVNVLASERSAPVGPRPIIVGPQSESPLPHTIVSSQAQGRVYGLECAHGGPRVKWSVRGRGASQGVLGAPWKASFGAVAGDVNGDGRDEVLLVRTAEDGHSILVALSLDGRELWQRHFPGFSGEAPHILDTATTFWEVGHFLDRGRLDIMVSNRRSTMHSDETLVLNSKTLEIAWHRDILRHQQPRTELTATRPRGCGGWITAHADFDRDGLDEIVNLWPSEYWVVRGDNGQQYADETLGPTPIDGIGNLYLICAYPLICDIDNDGQLETICCHQDMVLAFGHHTDRPRILWHTDRDDGAAGIPAVGDVNGDGMLELGLPGCRDGFRCLDAATGKVLWTVPRRSRADSFSNCACADVDNDGRKEFLYADGPVLLAVGEPKGRADPILWAIDVGANVEVIAVGDVDGDGFCEILVAGDDGNLYCISQ